MSIVLDGLTKVYAGRRVVDRVSLEVGDGELFVLLGSSGSGKSTVLRLIAGLSRADAGTVTLFGRDVTALPPQGRGVGFVFQNYSIFRHMTVARNIEFGLRLRGVSRSERRRKSGELLELIGLGGLGGRYANQLSGGQQQRVALARALAYEPRVLLLDEPFGALDAKIRLQLRRTLREIQQALHVTTILVTHDQDEAFELADRIGVVDRGRLLEVGTSEELYSRPESFFVATFLGAGVVLHGRCEEGHARFGALTLPIPEDLPHEEGGPVRVLIRPEQILLGHLPSGDAPATEPEPVLGAGAVVEEIFAGSTRRVRVRIPEQAGLRQIFPITPFGEEGILVDAVVPADRALPDEVLVALKGWRVLAQPEPRVLAASEAPETAATAAKLARAIGATVTVLGIAKDADRVDRTRTQIKEGLGEDAAGAEVRVRSGERIEQVLSELSESFYDLVVTDGGGEERRRMAGERTLLQRSRTPILFARNAGQPIQSLLICTAIGEPGRNDVRFGGWLAARLKARVLLLHVAAGGEAPPAWVRAHLERGVRTIKALGVEGDFKIAPAKTPLEGILAEAKTGAHDLVVIGRHAGRARSVRGKDDVTFQVLRTTDKPVLVVPADS